MLFKKIKPTTNGCRHQKNLNKALLAKQTNLIKNLIKKSHKTAGRSTKTGHITSWHRGGGKKHLLKNLDLALKLNSNNSIIISVENNVSTTAFNSLNFELKNKFFFYSKFIHNSRVGSLIKHHKNFKTQNLADSTSLKNLPAGSLISNIVFKKKTVYAKAAGTKIQLLANTKNFSKIKLPSKKIITVSSKTLATLGSNSNIYSKLTYFGKAGRARHCNRRPIVRGIAMNPVDHPHGGRANGGKPSVTPWGLPTKSKFSLKKRKKHYVKISLER